ncbi:hypothetical protein EXE44_15725 [Halorubrum sp. SS7]|uniref:hypothetical protein n=2 Tax=unclassified Halorubrum TaxID=2642239 RepID=UPI00113E591E|nr:hypothetical protein [Halorubrum sp. SP3]TKX56267.1 hypothetical protein EXE44_15725 [Halorubrum sp. SS7]
MTDTEDTFITQRERSIIYTPTKQECMNTWRQAPSSISHHEVGAGAVAAAATVVTSVIYLISLWAFVSTAEVPFNVEIYMLGYTGFVFFALFVTPLVGFVVGTAVWHWTLSSTSNPRRGALAGVVTAPGTVLAVSILFSLLLATRELLGVIPALFVSPVDAFVITTHGVVIYWGLFTSVILVPLCALIGWAYQRRVLSRSR